MIKNKLQSTNAIKKHLMHKCLVANDVTMMTLWSARECEGMNLHTPKWAPTLWVKVPMGSRIFGGRLQGSKFIGLMNSLYH